MEGWFSLLGSPQRSQRSQRILLVWLCVLSVLCGARFHLNNIEIIFRVAPALTGITSHFTSPKPPIQSKSACQPPHHKTGRSRSCRAPRQSEARGGGRKPSELKRVNCISMVTQIHKVGCHLATYR